MERICFTFQLRPGMEAEYKRRHDEIWPELVAAIKDAGISNYSLFRSDTRIIGYAECEPTAAAAFAAVGATDVSRRWTEWFVPEVIPGLAAEDGTLIQLDEVWHLD
jgi:L-rhamnose mutarotase